MKTIDDVMDEIGGFLEVLFPSTTVIRAQVNRVPMPPNSCIVLTELFQIDLSTGWQEYTPPTDPVPAEGTTNLHEKTRIDIQFDFYGNDAGDMCKVVKTSLRTLWGCDQFPDWIKPLYPDDGRQTPLITGEQQWQSRWTLTVGFEYDPVVIILSQQLAEVATVAETIQADA